jgi:hypothetical protein
MTIVIPLYLSVSSCHERKNINKTSVHLHHNVVRWMIYQIIIMKGLIPEGLIIIRPRWSSGSMPATGPKVRRFKPGRGRWIFKGDKHP